MVDHSEVWTDLLLKQCHPGLKVMVSKKELTEEENKEKSDDF
jgi:hypothetical protein